MSLEEEHIILDNLVEAQRGIKCTFDGLQVRLQEQADRNKAKEETIEQVVEPLTILSVMRAVLILTTNKKEKQSDEEVVASADDN